MACDIKWLKLRTSRDLAKAVDDFEQLMRNFRGPIRTYLEDNKKCIHGRDVYLECVYEGYLDASRRFKGIKNIPDYEGFLKTLFADVAGCISYFTKDITTVEQFNEWHKSTCRTIIDMMKTKDYAVTYGMAQKIVNMAFKYLYLVEKPEKDYLWQFCHMPLDSKILDWYRECIDSSQKTAWSNMDIEEYFQIQSKIRQYISSCSFCPIEVEYMLWH